MSRGFQRRGASFRARESGASAIPSAKDERFKLENRLSEMESVKRSISKWLVRAEMLGMKKSDIKSAKETLEAYEHALGSYAALVQSAKEGNSSAMMPKEGDKLIDEGAKLIASQQLKKEGVKYGPNISQLGESELASLLDVGSPNERLLVFNKDGDFMYGMQGEPNETGGTWPAEASPNPRGYTNYKGQEMHTHPVAGKAGRVFGGPPTPEDIDRLVRTGVSKSTIVAPEGRYVIEISDGVRSGISATGKDRDGVTKIASDLAGNLDIAWKRSQKEAGRNWENNRESFSKLVKSMSNEFMEATGGNFSLSFIPNPGYEELAFSKKGS